MGDRHKIVPPPYCPPPHSRTLEELPNTLGLVLWQILRHLRDWAETAGPARLALFGGHEPKWVTEKRVEARELAPELGDAFDDLLPLTRTPALVNSARLADACQRVADWAQQRGHAQTALQFAEAAAMVDPKRACRANAAGRATRDASEFSRAEVWFERGIGLARERRDHVEYTRGHLGAGILCMALGREERARRHFNTASAVAMRAGHEWLAAEAQHDLFHFMTVRGNFTDAELHARRALAWYPKHHVRYPYFVADFAFLLVCEHHFGAAATLLSSVLGVVSDPGPRVVILALYARAIAGSGRAKKARQLRQQVLGMLQESQTEWEAVARWHLAESERSAGAWDAAEASARLAIDLASARNDVETRGFARRLLSEIENRVLAPVEVKRVDEPFLKVQRTLLTRLAEWTPTRRGRAPRFSRREWAA